MQRMQAAAPPPGYEDIKVFCATWDVTVGDTYRSFQDLQGRNAMGGSVRIIDAVLQIQSFPCTVWLGDRFNRTKPNDLSNTKGVQLVSGGMMQYEPLTWYAACMDLGSLFLRNTTPGSNAVAVVKGSFTATEVKHL